MSVEAESDTQTTGLDTQKGDLRLWIDQVVSDHIVLVMIGPPLLVLLAVFVYPVFWVLYQSLWLPPIHFGDPHQFAPIGNYQRVITSPSFYESVWRTVLYTFGSLSLSFTVGLLVALAINRVGRRWLRQLYTMIITLGWAMPVAILSLTWRWILFPEEVGLLNQILLDLGMIGAPIAYLESEALALPIVTVIDAWVRMPLAMIVFLAGLQSIPERLYDAARVDGATSFQMFRYITLPYLRPYMATVGLMIWLFAFQAFSVIWNMTGGGPLTSTRTLSLYLFEIGIARINFGYGSAISAFIVGISTILTAFYVTITLDRRDV